MTGRRLIAAAALAVSGCGGGGEGAGTTPEELAADVGCLACHTESDTALAPSLHGIWGSERELADDSMVTVDDDYVSRSLVDPGADVVAGYGPTMPSMPLDEAEIDQLVAHLVSLLTFRRPDDACPFGQVGVSKKLPTSRAKLERPARGVLALDERAKCAFGTASLRAAPLARRNTRPDLQDRPLVDWVRSLG